VEPVWPIGEKCVVDACRLSVCENFVKKTEACIEYVHLFTM